MRRTVILAVAVAILVALSYGLGRKHGAATRELSRSPHDGESAEPLSSARSAKTAQNRSTPQETTTPKAAADADTFNRELASRRAGYQAAMLNLEDALSRIEALPVSERKGFTTGIFTFVARQRTPAEALALYRQQGTSVKADALRALASEWVSARSPLNEERRCALRERIQATGGGRFGLEVELAYALASSQPDDEVVSAWLDAFSAHPGRSAMLPALASKSIQEDPGVFLERTQTWTEWERERATRTVLEDWASRAPEAAWTWYQAHRDQLGPDLAGGILETWARSDPDAAKALLNTLSDPNQRLKAVESIGKALALKNSAEAVAWADHLQNPEEKSVAQSSIYDATPRGIGAAISMENGFPTLRSIVPDSPLSGTGIKPGDQFVEVWQPDGTHQSLYGEPLESAVKLIRGEPGSELVLRVLRRNERTGQLEELRVPVRRAQLYFNDKK